MDRLDAHDLEKIKQQLIDDGIDGYRANDFCETLDMLANNEPLLTVKIGGFLGEPTYNIDLPLIDTHRRVKIITGSSGCGKTTLLKTYRNVMMPTHVFSPIMAAIGMESIEVSGKGGYFKLNSPGCREGWSFDEHQRIVDATGINDVVDISPTEFYNFRYKEHNVSAVVARTVMDMEQSRLDIFYDMVRQGYFMKETAFDIDDDCRLDYAFVSRSPMGNGRTHKTPFPKMSLGQQWGLYVYATLLSHDNALFLIDGPEFCSHVVACHPFIDNLERICKMTNSRAIVATHSSSIIGCNWDIEYSLDCVRRGEEPQ